MARDLPDRVLVAATATVVERLSTGQRSLGGDTLRTPAPVGHVSLIDLVAEIVRGRQARCCAHGAVDIAHARADSADHVMMIVADAVFEERR